MYVNPKLLTSRVEEQAAEAGRFQSTHDKQGRASMLAPAVMQP